MDEENILKAVELIKKSMYIVGFTGAGISVESGVPPFRGEGGLWEIYDPRLFDISFFKEDPAKSWKILKDIFMDKFKVVHPNPAHKFLAVMEKKGNLKAIITQNIDNLHATAGNTKENIIEFHGNSQYFLCLECGKKFTVETIPLDGDKLPPLCDECNGLIKPDFVFFGEGIPPDAHTRAMEEAEKADLFILVGTSGVVMPAALIPGVAKQNGAKIIEINLEPSQYTDAIVDVFVEGKAGETFERIAELLGLKL